MDEYKKFGSNLQSMQNPQNVIASNDMRNVNKVISRNVNIKGRKELSSLNEEKISKFSLFEDQNSLSGGTAQKFEFEQ
jgi:hypothetical protein